MRATHHLMAEGHDERVRAQFTAQVDRFVAAPHVNLHRLVERFLALAEPRPTDRALDVACGPGLLGRDFGPHVGSFIGIDLTLAMVARGRQVARDAGLAHVHYAVGHARALPVPTAAIDLALTRLALHHIPEPGAVLAEMARVLRPGGRAGIFDMTTSEDPEEAAYHHRIEVLRDPSHARALPLSELIGLVGRAGLDVERLEVADYDLDFEDWVRRADQPAAAAAEARRLMAAAEGTRRFAGRRVTRDAAGRLCYPARAAILVARRFSSG